MARSRSAVSVFGLGVVPTLSPGRLPLLAAVAGLVLTSAAMAQGRDEHDHDHPQRDRRVTPRSAHTHETGTLPPARAATLTLENEARFVVEDGYRRVFANGIPDHETGVFPNRGNPNVVGEQQYAFRLPLDPPPPDRAMLAEDQVHPDRGHLFGVALNGVPYEPATGMNWTPEGVRRGGRPGGWVHEAIGGSVNFGIDHANAYVQRTGAYHYHGVPTPSVHDHRPTLIGYAADGYPIYGPLGYEDPTDARSRLVPLQPSWQLKTGPRPEPPAGPGGKPDGRYTADFSFKPGSGDLDRLNGRFGVTPEYPQGVYHYVVTEAFPHIARGFAGTPDPSFRRTPGEGPNHVGQRGERLPLGDRPGGRAR